MRQHFTLIILFIAGFSFSGSAQFWDFTEPKRLNETINSDAEESMPVFSEDSLILYFVRTFDATNSGGKGDQDIWFSRKDADGNYGKSEKLKAFNNQFNNAVCGLNQHGNSIYLLNTSKGKSSKDRGISVAEQKGSQWQSPKKIEIPTLDLTGNFVSFFVSKSEDVILVSFAGPASEGQEDLYYIQKQADQSWSKPLHMGNVLNTEGFEISPYLSAGKDTLFFSSNGHGGFGDADIFYSIRQDDSWTNWSEPVNLGEKINSSKFDAYLIFAGTQFYWSSNRGGENSDIYFSSSLQPPLIALSAQAILSFDSKTGHSIDLTANGGAGTLKYLWSNSDTNEDPKNLKPGVYTVTVTDDYGQKATLDVKIEEPVLAVATPKSNPVPAVDENPAGSDPVLAARDAEINKDLNNNIIYYDENSSYFNVENRSVLVNIVPILKAKPELKIFVQSYCDKQGTTEYNLWLSEKRMNRVIDYLVSNGIERSRISGNFKGETEPLVNCKTCNEKQLRLNRRTTIKFIP